MRVVGEEGALKGGGSARKKAVLVVPFKVGRQERIMYQVNEYY